MHPFHRTAAEVSFSTRLDVELHPDQGGVVEEKPRQRVQAGVLPTGRYRPETPRPDMSGAQPLRESVLLRWRKEYEARREAAFTEKQLSHSEALEARIAELERFCSKPPDTVTAGSPRSSTGEDGA